MLEEPWYIQLFGRLRVERRSTSVERFRTQRAGALLARLALFPRRAHSREELADLLWPEDDGETARAKLRIALSSLRRQLEPAGTGRGSVIVADRLCVRLNPVAFTTDVAQFEAALTRTARAVSVADKHEAISQAIHLHAGELLPGFYDDWIVLERERLEALFDALPGQSDTRQAFPQSLTPETPKTSGLSITRADAALTEASNVYLPLIWTRFFGREQELRLLSEWLPCSGDRLGPRVVTLIGPGGVGKTRLALEAARLVAKKFTQTICFVAMADVRDPDRLLPLIAEKLGLPQTAPNTSREAVLTALSPGPSLLVLDNLEQIADAVAPLLQNLLAQLPMLHCLITSRRSLNVPGGRLLSVHPLGVPPASVAADESGRAAQAADLMSYPGVAMFVDRAHAARPDFGLTPRNAATVGQLCAHLEGVPLALELASAWVGVLTPAQILGRLEERFSLLVSRRTDGTERHQTMRATLDWSFDLLPPSLQRDWARLSVFRGGWTPEAMTAVCPEAEGLETLARLRERSFVLAEETNDGSTIRFRMLETLREYGAERLTPDASADARQRHAVFFARLAEDAAPNLRGPEQTRWLDLLDQERLNLRAALAWCFTQASGPEGDTLGLALAGALGQFWMRRGPLAEGREQLTIALSRPGAQGRTLHRARALNGCGLIAWMQADYESARACHEEALSVRRLLGDPKAIAASLGNLGLVAVELRDYDEARRLGEEALALNRAAGDLRGQSIDLNNLGDVATHQGRHDDARVLYESSLVLRREIGDRSGEAITLGNLGLNAAVAGEFERAATCHRAALRLRREASDEWRMAFSLAHLADARRGQGFWDEAARLYGAAQALRDRIRYVNSPVRQEQLEGELAALRQAIGTTAFEAAYAAGYAQALDEAVRWALGDENP